MFEFFTDRAIAVVMLAQEEARRLNHTSVGTEQLLLGLLGEQTSLAARVLFEHGVTLEQTRALVLQVVGRGAGPLPSEIPFTPKTRQVLEQAVQEIRLQQSRYVGPEHLLLALLHTEGVLAVQILQQLGIAPNRLEVQLLAAMEEVQAVAAGPAKERFTRAKGRPSRSRTPMLDEFGTNLTEKAISGHLDPVVGRAQETERVIQILNRRTKNNPVLLGEPGVGKTAIAEGLAQRIADGQVPEALEDAQVILLDLTALVAGTRFRGEFEERLTQILAEVREAGNMVLVIDEIHTLVGAGVMGGGGADAANLLKPALARGEIQCLGATTLEEYRKYIERDAALERRFQPVLVGEPSVEETVQILQGLRSTYEQHHRVLISDAALEAAATLSERYISDRFLPDKAIDLIDEAASRVQLRFSQVKADRELKRQFRQVAAKKQVAIRNQGFVEAAQLHNQETQLETQIRAQHLAHSSHETVEAGLQWHKPQVEAEDIAQVIAAWTGIPTTKLSESESLSLLHLEDSLHNRVIGQTEAVQAIARAMRRSRANLANPDKPIASFFFSGPTGVGKTELSKALAELLFGSPEALIRFDMSEFMESHTVSKLIGAPPGFVGYEDSGKLTEAVRRRPYSVVLFDEVEKAHPDIFNLLLQVLDEGRIKDSQGRTVDFKNTVLIMTSNLGAKSIEKGGLGLGFSTDTSEGSYNQMRDRVLDDLKQAFRPEFLNRLDEIIVFRQLTQPEVVQICDLMVAEIGDRLAAQGIGLEVSTRFKDLAVQDGYDPRYGARPLRRTLQRLLEDALAEALLTGHIHPGDTALVDLDETQQVTVNPQRQLVPVG